MEQEISSEKPSDAHVFTLQGIQHPDTVSILLLSLLLRRAKPEMT